jgi:hypothetical protein
MVRMQACAVEPVPPQFTRHQSLSCIWDRYRPASPALACNGRCFKRAPLLFSLSVIDYMAVYARDENGCSVLSPAACRVMRQLKALNTAPVVRAEYRSVLAVCACVTAGVSRIGRYSWSYMKLYFSAAGEWPVLHYLLSCWNRKASVRVRR